MNPRCHPFIRKILLSIHEPVSTELPDLVNEPENSYLDAYYKFKPLGVFGTGVAWYFPFIFAFLSIFGFFDLINWYVRRALAARRRRRREERRRRRRGQQDGAAEIPNRFVAAAVRVLGFLFYRQIAQVTREEQQRAQQEQQRAQQENDTRSSGAPTYNSFEDDAASPEKDKLPSDDEEDDDSNEKASSISKETTTNSSGDCSEPCCSYSTKSTSTKSDGNASFETEDSALHSKISSVRSSEFMLRFVDEQQRSVFDLRRSNELQRSESIRTFLEEQQESLSSGHSSKRSQRRRRKSHRK